MSMGRSYMPNIRGQATSGYIVIKFSYGFPLKAVNVFNPDLSFLISFHL